MRVLSIGSIPPAWGGTNAGGVAAYHAALVEATENSSSVVLAAILPLNHRGVESELAPKIVLFPPASSSEEKQYYAELVPKFDVVIFHHIHHRWMQYHIRTGRQRPSVGFIHSWHPITFARDQATMEMYRDRTQLGLEAVNALVFPSQHTMNEGKALGLSWNCPTFVIHHPLQAKFAETREQDAADRKQILFVGELTPRKNPLGLLEAVSRIPGQGVTFLGGGELAPDLERLAAEWGLRDRVRLLGRVIPSIVKDELNRSAVMCLPSCSESFGIVYIEALACGTPVVGFKPTLDEIEAAMGVSCGVGLPNEAVETLVGALKTVIASSWDRPLLRSRAIDRFSGHRAISMLADALAAAQAHHAS